MFKAGLLHYWSHILRRNSKRPDASLVTYMWAWNFVLAMRFEMYMICSFRQWGPNLAVIVQVLSYLCATVWCCLLNFMLCDTLMPLYARDGGGDASDDDDDDARRRGDANLAAPPPPPPLLRVRNNRANVRRHLLAHILYMCHLSARKLKERERLIINAETRKEQRAMEESTAGRLHKDERFVISEYLRCISLIENNQWKFRLFFRTLYHICAWCLLFLAFPRAYIRRVGDHLFVCVADEMLSLLGEYV